MMRILITGASGSGTSTLGLALAQKLGIAHFDADDYFWLPTDPPYVQRRDTADRLALLLRDLSSHDDATLTGSIDGWGSLLEDSLDLVVFLYADAAVRIERLLRRETERYGKVNPPFLKWASEYDVGPSEGRSLAGQRAWLSKQTCPVLELSGEASLENLVDAVLKAIRQEGSLSAIRS
jgi:adenylate kinase family enzyme